MYGKGSAPSEVMDGFLCQHFGCLPGQLDDEDGVRLLNIVYAQNVAEAFRRVQRNQQTAEDNQLIGPILREEARREQ